MKKVLLEAKETAVGISRNGRIVVTCDKERYIASKSISEQVLADLDDDLDEAEKAEAIIMALAGYTIFENEDGVKFISNVASEVIKVTVDTKAIKKVKDVEAETFNERLARVKKTFDLTKVGVAM